MCLADRLSRFQHVPWTEPVRCWNILDTCNELFDVLWEAPRNICKSAKDIPTGLRILYGIDLRKPIEKEKQCTVTEHNILRTPKEFV